MIFSFLIEHWAFFGFFAIVLVVLCFGNNWTD